MNISNIFETHKLNIWSQAVNNEWEERIVWWIRLFLGDINV